MILKQVRKDRRDSRSCFLLEYTSNVTSQFGEDGILRKLFEIIGEKSRWCVDVGAWDGRKLSNTWDLVENRNWSGVLIEGAASKFPKLQRTYAGTARAVCVQGIVQPVAGPGSLDDFLRRTPLPARFDLLSIDIDGNDYHVWDSLTDYKARVVVIEFNPCIPNDVVFVQDADPAINQGSSLRALIELGRRKGYELACVTSANAIFVGRKEYPKLGIPDNDIDLMAFPKRDGKYFDGYDGTLFHVGSPKLHWVKDIRIGPEQLQVLEPSQRVYNNAISEDPSDPAVG
jgi:hypothetical protein